MSAVAAKPNHKSHAKLAEHAGPRLATCSPSGFGLDLDRDVYKPSVAQHAPRLCKGGVDACRLILGHFMAGWRGH